MSVQTPYTVPKIKVDVAEEDALMGGSRNVRRKSITVSPRMLSPPDPNDFPGNHSPANSITSVNSLASLLREKNTESTSDNTKKEVQRLQNQSVRSVPVRCDNSVNILCVHVVQPKNPGQSLLRTDQIK